MKYYCVSVMFNPTLDPMKPKEEQEEPKTLVNMQMIGAGSMQVAIAIAGGMIPEEYRTPSRANEIEVVAFCPADISSR